MAHGLSLCFCRKNKIKAPVQWDVMRTLTRTEKFSVLKNTFFVKGPKTAESMNLYQTFFLVAALKGSILYETLSQASVLECS